MIVHIPPAILVIHKRIQSVHGIRGRNIDGIGGNGIQRNRIQFALVPKFNLKQAFERDMMPVSGIYCRFIYVMVSWRTVAKATHRRYGIRA